MERKTIGQLLTFKPCVSSGRRVKSVYFETEIPDQCEIKPYVTANTE